MNKAEKSICNVTEGKIFPVWMCFSEVCVESLLQVLLSDFILQTAAGLHRLCLWFPPAQVSECFLPGNRFFMDGPPACVFFFFLFFISQPRWTWKWKWTHVTPASCQILLLSQFFLSLSLSVLSLQFWSHLPLQTLKARRANSLWIMKLLMWFCVGAAPHPHSQSVQVMCEQVSAVNQTQTGWHVATTTPHLHLASSPCGADPSSCSSWRG